jgi:DNA-binding NarL/FixJ family response regulator
MNELVILAIDDHLLFTNGLERLVLERFPYAQFVAVPGLGQAVQSLKRSPSLILLDFNLVGISGRAAVALTRQHWPDAPIFIVSSNAVNEVEAQIRDLPDVTVMSKAIAAEQLLDRIATVLAVGADAQAGFASKPLSPRQLEVLRHLREGRSNKAIAAAMGLSEFTVRGHVQQLFKVIGASNRTNAVYLAEQARLI